MSNEVARPMTPEECRSRGGSGDPRTLWVSADGEIAVILTENTPAGVARSGSWSVPQKWGHVSAYLSPGGIAAWVSSGPGSSFVPGQSIAAVMRKHLPWEVGGPRPVVVNGTFSIPAGKVVADWPHACPKCKRSDSAVLLFMGWDCKHGCFK